MNSNGFQVVRRQGVLPPDTTRGITKRRTPQKPVFDNAGAVVAGVVGAGVLAFATGQGILAAKYGPEQSLKMQGRLLRNGTAFVVDKSLRLGGRVGIAGTKVLFNVGKEIGKGMAAGTASAAQEGMSQTVSGVQSIATSVYDAAQSGLSRLGEAIVGARTDPRFDPIYGGSNDMPGAGGMVPELVQAAESLHDSVREGVASTRALMARANEAATEGLIGTMTMLHGAMIAQQAQQKMRAVARERMYRRGLAAMNPALPDDEDDEEISRRDNIVLRNIETLSSFDPDGVEPEFVSVDKDVMSTDDIYATLD